MGELSMTTFRLIIATIAFLAGLYFIAKLKIAGDELSFTTRKNKVVKYLILVAVCVLILCSVL